MAGGVQAGRLNIEIVADIARLQADLDKTKRLVSAASGDIARNAKAANDNLAAIGVGAGAGVKAFARDVTALKAQLDPAWAAQQKYNQQVQLGMKAFRDGAIDRQGFITHMRQINAELKGVTPQMQGVTGVAGRMRGGMQQLSFQIGDVGQQFALGINPMTIFAQQGGQVFQALGMMQKEAKGFIGFMAGPWGAVLAGAVMILGMVAKSLLDNKAAAEAAAKALKTFQDRQSDIGNFIDDTTGRLKEQNKTLVLNAILTRQAQIDANNLASTKGRNAAFTAATSRGNLSGSLAGAAGLAGLSSLAGGPGIDAGQFSDPDVQKAIKDAKGNVDALATSIANLAKTKRPDLKGLALDITTQAGAAIIAQRENDKLNQELAALSGNTKALNASTTAGIERMVALATATTQTSKAQARLNDVKAAAAAIDKMGPGKAKDTALLQYQKDLTAATVALNEAQSDTKAASAAASAAKAAENHAESLGRLASATDIVIAGLYATATAYGVSDAAAIKAAANAKATEQAITKQGDRQLFVAQEMQRIVAEQVKSSAQATADLNYQAKAQEFVNDQVAKGVIAQKDAAEALSRIIAQRQMMSAVDLARMNNDTKGLAAAEKALSDFTKAQLRDIAAKGVSAKAADAQAEAQKRVNAVLDQLGTVQRLKNELALIGLVGEARERAILAQEKEAFVLKLGAALWEAYAAARNAIIDKNAGIAADAAATQAMLDNLDAIANRAADIGDIFRDAFGGIGGVIGDAISRMTDFQAIQADLADQVARKTKTQAQADMQLASIQAKNTAAMIGGVKSLFKEKSAAYKAISVIEKVHAAFEFAMMVKSMIQDTAKTASSVANSSVRATAKGAEGAATIFSQLGAFGFPVVAAMVAVLAGLGIAGLSGGGGAAVKPPSPEDIQAKVGTGTVLGSPDEKSASIANALDIMASNSNTDLEYSNEAVKHLRDINAGISGLTAAIARQLNMSGGAFDTSGFKLGSNSSSGLLGLGIFGSTTTKSLYDQGLNVFSATVDDILSGRFNAQVYSVIETIKKSSGFLGIGGGTKTTYSTVTGAAPADIERQIALIVGDVSSGVIALAGQIGLDVADSIRTVAIPAAQLSFADMSGEDIEAALNAYFSSVADAITQGGLSSSGFNVAYFQQAGEGLFETLSRLTRTMMTVTSSLKSIGMEQNIGTWPTLMQKTATEQNLVNVFGDLDAMQEAIAGFAEDFLSEAERMAPVIAAVRAEMDRLGFAGVTTNDQFKSLVQSMDLTGFAGRETFAALLAVAPAFAQVNEYLAQIGETAGAAGKTLAELAAIEKQHRSLEIELMTALGDSAGALAAKRADDLAAMDESNRALQQIVWDTQDAAKAQADLAAATALAAQAAETLAKQRRGLEIDLMTALGDAEGALAAQRADALSALPETLRALQQQIWTALDATAAATALATAQQAQADIAAQAAEQLLAIATKRRDLEIQLMTALGDGVGALAAIRADELAALDPTLRALQETVWAAQDAAAAIGGVSSAFDLLKARADLEIRLMDALGDAQGALNARREQERATTDVSLQGLLAQIFTAEDAATAAQKLADAQAEGARIAENAAREAERMAAEVLRAAEELARAMQAIADKRASLEIDLMRALGDETGALAAQRQLELAALDPTLRALQQQVWTALDAAAAQKALADAQAEATRVADDAAKAAAQRVTDARSVLVDAYKREAGALGDTIDKFAAFGASLRDFRAGIFATNASMADSYRTAQVKLMMTGALAQAGDVNALGSLQGVAQTFLDASRARATSQIQLQRDQATVARMIDAAIGATDGVVNTAQASLTALQQLVAGQIETVEAIIGVPEALAALLAAEAGYVAPSGSAWVPGMSGPPSDNPEVQALREEVASLRSQISGQSSDISTIATEAKLTNRTLTGLIDRNALRTREAAV